MTRIGRSLVLAAVAWLPAVGCGDGGVAAAPSEPLPAPEVLASTAAAGPENVLSAVVTARVLFADSVLVAYGPAGEPRDSVTPAVRPLDYSVAVPVLGLLPGTSYVLEAIAYGAGEAVAGDTLLFTTDTLPSDLPRYFASGPDPSPGFVVFAAGRYGLVIDNTGRVVWYRRFPNGAGLNFQAQPTGRYYVRPPTPDPADREPWLELDALGAVVRSFGCANNLLPRFHDLIAAADGGYWVMCDEMRTMDLTAEGGVANAQVTGTVIQHLSAAGELLFQWSPFDHFAITDLDAASRTGTTVNWTHGNALDLDSDGNLVVSFRSLSEITKIDTRTGAVLWRMGGLGNEFAFQGTPLPAFARQHGLRLTAPASFVLLDNMGDPQGTRAERYLFDEGQRIAQQVASYGSEPAVTALLGGTTQALPGDRTLVAFGNGGRVEEYDAAGRVVWRIDGNPGYVFRAQRIRSLYAPGVGTPR